MKQILALTLAAATLMGATSVSSQTIELGPRGPSIDLRSERERDRDRDREYRRGERVEREIEPRRRYRDREVVRDERACRTVTVRERDAYGNVEVRRRREC